MKGNPTVRNSYENVDKDDLEYKRILRKLLESQKEVITKAATTMLGGKLLLLCLAGTGKTVLMMKAQR